MTLNDDELETRKDEVLTLLSLESKKEGLCENAEKKKGKKKIGQHMPSPDHKAL